MMTWTSPILPSAGALPWGIAVSWGVVCAACLYAWSLRWDRPSWRIVAALVLLSSLLPWTRGWTAHLALAFQTPSWVTLLACVALAWPARASHTPACGWTPWAGWLLGWALWLDAFNRWPTGWEVSLYAWGFGAPALWAAMLCVAAAAVWTWRRHGAVARVQVIVALALLAFALTRGPTGNVWDALLDPWLWLVCHVDVLRQMWRSFTHWRTSKYSRQNSNASGV